MKKKIIGILICMMFIVVPVLSATGTIYNDKSKLKEQQIIVEKISTWEDVDWWPMFHHDLNHSGYSTSDAPETNNVKWTYNTGDRYWVYSSPAVSDCKVYIGSGDYNVYCLDADNGTKIWNYTTGGVMQSSPAVANGKIYIGSDDGKVYCLDADNGTEIWNYNTGEWYWVYSSPAVSDGKVYIGSSDKKVYCLDADNGTEIWNFRTGKTVYSCPAVSDCKVYIGSEDGKVYCLDADNGTEIWNYTTGDWVDSSPAVADGKVYIGSRDKKVYCLDADNGTEIWNYTTGDWVYSSPAVADGKVYIGSEDGKVYCFGDNGGNQPPNEPTITGPTSGKVGVEYQYNFSLSDPDEDQLYLRIDWGNGTPGPWQGPYNTDTTVKLNHTWNQQGNFTIRAQAKDINNIVSEWGTHEVIIPRHKATTNSLFLWFLERFPLLREVLSWIINL